MDISEIDYPEHLNEHNLTQQELEELTTLGSRARAMDLNIINRKIDWLIRETVFCHNLLVRHDQAIEIWRRVYWLFGLVGGSIVGLLTIGKILGWIK